MDPIKMFTITRATTFLYQHNEFVLLKIHRHFGAARLTYAPPCLRHCFMPVAHGKIFCQIYFIKRFMKQNFIKCTLLMEKVYKILSSIKYFKGGLVAQAVRRSPPTAGVPSSRLSHSM